jgi:ribokinase
VAFIGRVGADADGAWLRESLAGAGVDVAGLGIDPRAPTGMAVITVDEAGQNQIVLVPGANESLSPQALEPHRERLARAHVLLLQLEIPLPTVEAAARIVRAAGGLVVLDPAPAQPVPDALLALCDYVTPNESELCALVGRPAPRAGLDPDEAAAAARRLLARGARAVIVKRGAAGALLVTPAGHEAWPAFPVRAVDTTAAGDTFNGALAAGLAEGLALADAGRFACAAAALAVTRPGAQPSIPDRAETLAFLRAARP